jgi:Mg-chelatase subunit ChlD
MTSNYKNISTLMIARVNTNNNNNNIMVPAIVHAPAVALTPIVHQQQQVSVTRTVTKQPKCRYGARCYNRHNGKCADAHPVVVAVIKEPSDVMCLFNIDVSGSMMGAKIVAAAEGMALVAQEAMKPRDVVAVHTFNATCETAQKFTRNNKIDWSSLGHRITASCVGTTALFDAICASVHSLRQLSYEKRNENPNQVRVFVLLTDGADTASKQRTFDDAVAAIAKPGIRDFHFVLLGVGLDDATMHKFRDELCAPAHAMFVPVQDADAKSIRRAFGTVTKKITQLKAQKTVTTTVTTVTDTVAVAAAQPIVRRHVTQSSNTRVIRMEAN